MHFIRIRTECPLLDIHHFIRCHLLLERLLLTLDLARRLDIHHRTGWLDHLLLLLLLLLVLLLLARRHAGSDGGSVIHKMLIKIIIIDFFHLVQWNLIFREVPIIVLTTIIISHFIGIVDIIIINNVVLAAVGIKVRLI